jgi:hypothetical protein
MRPLSNRALALVPSRASRVSAALAVATAISLSGLGCADDSECDRSDVVRCKGAVAQQCLDHEALFGGSNFTWGGDIDCGSPDLCILEGTSAYCALYPTPDPLCLRIKENPALCGTEIPACLQAGTLVCGEDGLSMFRCHSGYIVEKTACTSCTLPPVVTVACSGALGSQCQTDADCASGSSCHLGGQGRHCSRPCTCSSAIEACFDCRDALDSLANPSNGSRVCYGGWCG